MINIMDGEKNNDTNKKITSTKLHINDEGSSSNQNTNIESNKTLDDYILDLKIISKIKANHKLSIINNKICIDTNYFQLFTRYINNNSRTMTIEYLDTLDKNLMIHIEKLINSKDTDLYLVFNSRSNILLTLSYDLKLSTIGLNNLINTYQKDELMVSKLEIIINNFNLKIQKISAVLKL